MGLPDPGADQLQPGERSPRHGGNAGNPQATVLKAALPPEEAESYVAVRVWIVAAARRKGFNECKRLHALRVISRAARQHRQGSE